MAREQSTESPNQVFPGQAFFNAHFHELSIAFKLIMRLLGILCIGVAVGRIAGWIDTSKDSQVTTEGEGGEGVSGGEEVFEQRGWTLLWFLAGVQLVVRTIPTPEERQKMREAKSQ